MQRRVGIHGMNKANVINAGAEMREQVRHHLAAFTVAFEFPLGTNDPPLALATSTAKGLDLDGLSIKRIEIRLVVEGVDLAGTAIHEEEDYVLRLRLEVRLLDREGILELAHPIGRHRLVSEEVAAKHPREGGTCKPATGLPEKFPASPTTELVAAAMSVH